MYDVVIIGAGVTGCAVARYLSRYNLRSCVIEKEEDVCCGTSKANSAIVHAGFDAVPGSMMAKMNALGSRMMPELSKELDFPFINNGSLVVCTDKESLPHLQELYERGLENGIEMLTLIDREKLLELEPNISDNAIAALWAPTGGIVCPFNLTIALAENACENGVEFKFNSPVSDVTQNSDGTWSVKTCTETIQTRCVVNAAGVYADVFHNMVSNSKIHITPRKGEYFLLDHTAAGHVTRTIFQLPDKFGKGVLVSPTVHGNLLVGPTAEDIEDKEGTNTTSFGIEKLRERCVRAVKNVPLNQVITGFAGLRAHEDGHEFIIGEVPDAPGFFDCAGIESPGLSSAPAIGLTVADLIRNKLGAEVNPDFVPTRKGILNPKDLSEEEYAALIKEKPAYGQIICRCETVTEGEIIDAIHRNPGARSLDGVKRRTRAGMGRCQAGFCSPRVMEIIARELNIPISEVTKKGGSSKIIVGTAKDSL